MDKVISASEGGIELHAITENWGKYAVRKRLRGIAENFKHTTSYLADIIEYSAFRFTEVPISSPKTEYVPLL